MATESVLVPGVTYERTVANGTVSHIVRIQPSPLITIRPERAGAQVTRRTYLTTMMGRRASAGALVGVNGDYFNYAGGYPSGLLLDRRRVDPRAGADALGLGILSNGRLTAVRAELTGEWTSSLQPDQTTPFGFSGHQPGLGTP